MKEAWISSSWAGTSIFSCPFTSQLLVFRLSALNYITPLAFLVLQLADGRLWYVSASITSWASSYSTFPLYLSCWFCFSGELWLILILCGIWASLVAQTIICLQCRRPRFDPWVGKIPWRREWQPTPIFLTREIHEQRRQAGYSPWGRKELDTTEQLTHTHTCEMWTWGGKVHKRGTVRRGAWYGILGARKGDVQGPRSLDAPPSGRGLCASRAQR